MQSQNNKMLIRDFVGFTMKFVDFGEKGKLPNGDLNVEGGVTYDGTNERKIIYDKINDYIVKASKDKPLNLIIRNEINYSLVFLNKILQTNSEKGELDPIKFYSEFMRFLQDRKKRIEGTLLQNSNDDLLHKHLKAIADYLEETISSHILGKVDRKKFIENFKADISTLLPQQPSQEEANQVNEQEPKRADQVVEKELEQAKQLRLIMNFMREGIGLGKANKLGSKDDTNFTSASKSSREKEDRVKDLDDFLGLLDKVKTTDELGNLLDFYGPAFKERLLNRITLLDGAHTTYPGMDEKDFRANNKKFREKVLTALNRVAASYEDIDKIHQRLQFGYWHDGGPNSSAAETISDYFNISNEPKENSISKDTSIPNLQILCNLERILEIQQKIFREKVYGPNAFPKMRELFLNIQQIIRTLSVDQKEEFFSRYKTILERINVHPQYIIKTDSESHEEVTVFTTLKSIGGDSLNNQVRVERDTGKKIPFLSSSIEKRILFSNNETEHDTFLKKFQDRDKSKPNISLFDYFMKMASFEFKVKAINQESKAEVLNPPELNKNTFVPIHFNFNCPVGQVNIQSQEESITKNFLSSVQSHFKAANQAVAQAKENLSNYEKLYQGQKEATTLDHYKNEIKHSKDFIKDSITALINSQSFTLEEKTKEPKNMRNLVDALAAMTGSNKKFKPTVDNALKLIEKLRKEVLVDKVDQVEVLDKDALRSLIIALNRAYQADRKNDDRPYSGFRWTIFTPRAVDRETKLQGSYEFGEHLENKSTIPDSSKKAFRQNLGSILDYYVKHFNVSKSAIFEAKQPQQENKAQKPFNNN